MLLVWFSACSTAPHAYITVSLLLAPYVLSMYTSGCMHRERELIYTLIRVKNGYDFNVDISSLTFYLH
jgi:hypothetical protein